ncbi:MAG TPA: hypothetical protein ENJ20_02605, partial [Bacteroidetes bacterium]|nr:hypothetical protein [Bacteroidota bacterium]
MQNNLLIQSLAALPRKKVTRFGEFAHSPYFNKHKGVRDLVTYLTSVYPHYTKKKCHRQTIYQNLFPTLPFDQKKLAIIFTYTMRLLEQFLRTEAAVSDGLLTDNALLLKELRENGILFLTKKYWKENAKGVKETTNPSTIFTSAGLRLLNEMDRAATLLADFNHGFLEHKQPAFDAYFLMEKLKDGCELLQRSKLLKRNFTPTPFFEKTLQWLTTSEATLPRPVRLYTDLYALLQTGDPDHYDQLLEKTTRSTNDFNTDDLAAFYNSMQNFCIRQINAGKKEFLVRLFSIYRTQLEKDLLLTHGYLSEWHFKNIVTTALRLEEYNWAKNFISKNKELLRPAVRQNAYSFNLANYYYHTGHYEKVLELLLRVEYTDLRYNLDAKSLLLRTYFDMEEEDAFFSLTDSFQQYLKRNRELTEFQKKGYYNLIKFSRTAFRLKINQ